MGCRLLCSPGGMEALPGETRTLRIRLLPWGLPLALARAPCRQVLPSAPASPIPTLLLFASVISLLISVEGTGAGLQ